MNRQLFEMHQKELFDILDNSGMSNKEIQLRKKRIIQSIELIQSEESPQAYSQYHQRAHEIQSIPFLKQFGTVNIAEEHNKGSDFILNRNIHIECVCASTGDISKNKLNEFMGEGLFDYGKKKEILNTRFTSSLYDKMKFYNDRVGKSIPENSPYVIFLSTGSLASHWFEEEYGMALLDILIGRGNLTIIIDTTIWKLLIQDIPIKIL